MNHSDIQDHMADYLEGHLSLEKRALFDAHLDDCGTCMSEIRDVQRTVNLLRSLPEPEVPVGFTDSVMRRVREADDRPHWLRSISEAFSILSSPRILVPISVSMIALGILAGTGQVEDALFLETPARGIGGSSRNCGRAAGRAGEPGSQGRRDSYRGSTESFLEFDTGAVSTGESRPGSNRTPRPEAILSCPGSAYGHASSRRKSGQVVLRLRIGRFEPGSTKRKTAERGRMVVASPKKSREFRHPDQQLHSGRAGTLGLEPCSTSGGARRTG